MGVEVCVRVGGIGVPVGGVPVGVGPPTMVKLTSDTSKKMLVEQATWTRAWVVETLGAVTPSVPSLAVPRASASGQVLPPSVETVISTRAQLTGGAVVFATSQVTVWALPPAQVTAVLGAVTRNGPELVVTGILTLA